MNGFAKHEGSGMGLAKRKIGIVGGGVGGLTFALALRKRGVPCRVFEKYDHFQHHRTGFLIWSYAIKILQALDVAVEEAGAPLEYFEIFGRKGQPVTRMPIGAVSREHGADSYEMNRRLLIQIMSEMVGEDLQPGKPCVAVESNESVARISFADGSFYDADVVIGCDGANSVVRKWVQPDARLNVFNAGGWIGVLDQHPAALKANCHMDYWEPALKAGVADIGNGQARWYVGMNGKMPNQDRSKKTQVLEAIPFLP
ncbi:MAG: FAD-dependent monooxygenase, partial [Pirellulaceae bacterium]|nr:FAD-dependent monooxygenase [Pirellulaceae bacterium]